MPDEAVEVALAFTLRGQVRPDLVCRQGERAGRKGIEAVRVVDAERSHGLHQPSPVRVGQIDLEGVDRRGQCQVSISPRRPTMIGGNIT